MTTNPKCNHCGEDVVFRGYCRRVLENAFNLVSTKGDWKASIDAHFVREMRNEVDAAIVFFTATEPTFHDIGIGRSPNRLRVTADGYRMGPAGP